MFDAHRYRGRHRAPTTAGKTAAKLAAVGVTVAAPLALAQPAYAAPQGGWDPVIQCESGGRNVEHGGDPGGASTASGYFQFLDSTWRAFGGQQFAPRAIQASLAEQTIVADRAFARNGLSDWAASQSCWASKIGANVGSQQQSPAREAPEPARNEPPRQSAPDSEGGVYTVRSGDTLSGIAARHGTIWPALYEANRDVVEDPDLIFPGERLRLP